MTRLALRLRGQLPTAPGLIVFPPLFTIKPMLRMKAAGGMRKDQRFQPRGPPMSATMMVASPSSMTVMWDSTTTNRFDVVMAAWQLTTGKR